MNQSTDVATADAGLGLTNTRRPRAGRMASSGAIRDAAAALFLEKGYQATSMDDIATAAQVSKQTIYTHFANKEELFSDLVLGNVDRVEAFVATIARTAEETADLEASLRHLAGTYLRFVIRPEVLRLRRLVLGEAGRFPELARTYYERVPDRIYSALANLFKVLDDRGQLRIEDPSLAAQHFAWLTLGMPLDRGMFYPIEAATPTAEMDRIADAAVRVFMAAYASVPSARSVERSPASRKKRAAAS
jgi:TetR/AcrR family transcriptional regulator, mexJK operon transcriptional repressor